MNNKDKIILDLWGGSGSWSAFYKKAGYRVIVVTLPAYDIYKVHFRCDNCITIIGEKGCADMQLPYKQIYGILAAPICTMFSLARTTAKTPRNFALGMKGINATLQIIWKCRIRNKLKFWALENPAGFLRQFIGKPILTFNPCDYGDPYTKRTDLWGYFNTPKKNPVHLTAEQKSRCAINNRKLPIDIKGQANRRAITPAGFAKAFYEANK